MRIPVLNARSLRQRYAARLYLNQAGRGEPRFFATSLRRIESLDVIIRELVHTFGRVSGLFRRYYVQTSVPALTEGFLAVRHVRREVARDFQLDVCHTMYIHSPMIPAGAHYRTSPDVVAKKKKKDAQLVLRLNKDLRNRFVDVCQELDTTAAREVRRFIKRFLKRYEKGEYDE